ncbi:MAG: HD-GYP domain-containing protein [Oceanospirillaceae bacterium]|nr:HD-GYP domain-containing protein [Oceanospirillaceae bacterium]MCP5335326.1 HD-GYP domain-containing protein [Oceanospirillaceae bacterium]MCP5350721.1 HD-GYP domain-containing protein [Oceanospirillaceae bacterium]
MQSQAMIKKIPITALRVGMYVTNITQRGITLTEQEREGRVKDQATIDQLIARGVTFLYIDVKQGDDCSEGVPLTEVDAKHQQDMQTLVEKHAPLSLEPTAELGQELKKAEKLHHQALDLVYHAMEAAKAGKNVSISPFEQMADGFVSSVFRNQNALACLSRIRDKDSYLMEHSVNVAVLMSILGKHLQLDPTTLHQCVTGALLHDIGKILIPDSVLHKPGKLTDEEFFIMKKHSTFSRDILKRSGGFPDICVNIAGQHHERLDGNGYPDGLKGDNIAAEARMASVVDIYDAITADRVYHKGMTPSVALKRMLEWVDFHLDKQYLHAFIKAIGIYPVGSLVELESGRLAVVIAENLGNTLKPTLKIIYNAKTQHYLPVEIIDLSQQEKDKILRTADPQEYKINLKDFML